MYTLDTLQHRVNELDLAHLPCGNFLHRFDRSSDRNDIVPVFFSGQAGFHYIVSLIDEADILAGGAITFGNYKLC